MLKNAAKALLSHLAPDYYASLTARRARAHSERLESEWGCSQLTKAFISEHGPVVKRGPFAGVLFVPETHHRHLLPKLVGAYEEELNGVWAAILKNDYPQILDIGAAEGYYATGLALRYPHSQIHAFDTDEWARRINRLMAAENEVDNVRVHGACTQEWLRSNLLEGALIL